MIPIAGAQVTNDIAMALRTPSRYAEEIKIKYACALNRLVHSDETIMVPGVGQKPRRDMPRQALAEVVEPRYEELFRLIRTELRRSGFEQMLGAGIVLTGGSSKMEGAVELAEEIFEMPVSVGNPRAVEGLPDIVRNPIYATGVGLLVYGQQHENGGQNGHAGSRGIFNRIGKWFGENV